MKFRNLRFLTVLVVFAAFLGTAHADLAAVGPLDPDNRFPMWYSDAGLPAEGLAPIFLGACLDGSAFCLPPGNGAVFPYAFPANFPDEFFYWTSDALIEIPSGDALLVLALEGAFAAEVPAAGDQVVFSRLRIRVDTPNVGTFTVTHPFGVDVFDVTDAAAGINETRDIGVAAGVFDGALTSPHNGPFLRWDPAFPPAAPAGYIGNPNVDHRIVGSPLGTNFFRVDGPNIGGPGVNTVETPLFAVSGKIATNFGVTVTRASYERDATGAGFVDLFATSVPGKAIRAGGLGTLLPLKGLGGGKYFGRRAAALPAAIPVLSVRNTTDVPVTVVPNVVPQDIVTITAATFNVASATNGRGVFTITATSSDLLAGTVLTAFRADGTTLLGTFTAVPAPGTGFTLTVGTPAAPVLNTDRVIVKSNRGGAATLKPIITGLAW